MNTAEKRRKEKEREAAINQKITNLFPGERPQRKPWISRIPQKKIGSIGAVIIFLMMLFSWFLIQCLIDFFTWIIDKI